MSNILTATEQLQVGDSLKSPSGAYQLMFQPDGNLMLSRVSDQQVLWATETAGMNASQAIMRPDGNFVVCEPNHATIWSSATSGRHGANLTLQEDGNLVIYAKGSAIWSSDTQQDPHPEILSPGSHIAVNDALTSPGGAYQLRLQADGNLVLYQMANHQALWVAATQSLTLLHAIMQPDGNFVLYNTRGQVLWATGTNGQPGAELILQRNGDLVIRHLGQTIWSTTTAQSGPSARRTPSSAVKAFASANAEMGVD